MSSKKKTAATKEDGEPSLVPKLRFAEFTGEPIRKVQLGDVTEECTARHSKKLISAPIKGVSKTDGIVPMEERLIGKDIARYKLVSTGLVCLQPDAYQHRVNRKMERRRRNTCKPRLHRFFAA